MKTLGVVLAGGRSSRFGTDKADALLAGRSLLDHALDALVGECDAIAIVGRASSRALTIEDWPKPGMGPLGGLAGALRHARHHGFDRVLSIPVDAGRTPTGFGAALSPAPAFAVTQPVIGLWPVDAAEAAEAILYSTGKHSMRAFTATIGARAVALPLAANINTPHDLARLEQQHGL